MRDLLTASQHDMSDNCINGGPVQTPVTMEINYSQSVARLEATYTAPAAAVAYSGNDNLRRFPLEKT